MLDKVTRDTLEQRVLTVVKEVLAVEDAGVSIDSSIVEDLEADSLDQLTLFMALEDEFGDDIPQEDARAFHTLRDVVDYIADRTNLSSA